MEAGEGRGVAQVLRRRDVRPGRQTAHVFVHETLRNAILDGDLSGGTRLIQSEVAEALGVSATPVREALRDLAAEGLIRLDAHRGGVVHQLSLKELAEIYQLRSILEPEAIRRAWPNLTDEVVDSCAKLHEAMQQHPPRSEWVWLNSRFHDSVFELADAPRLLAILASLTAPWIMYVSASLASDVEHQYRASAGHEEILAALRARDLDAMIEATLEHLAITHRTLEAADGAPVAS
jgi:DNA-binding GntR family transcriptional regulator